MLMLMLMLMLILKMNMNMFAQMHGFNDPSELMMMYQQNMLNMMQSVLAPVINATADIVINYLF